ncbi:MAG: TIGR03905 family TSCPD domain-containing protein [Clostridia bacterium]|nr:TIGR03905 family TSCPD domain-containing protein [Clostridia bacterium]
MTYTYKTQGTCSRKITFDLEDGIVKNVNFEGGCNGNLKGISALVEGKEAEEVIKTVSGITCGFKSTSCPDQLARALHEALNS